MTTKIYRPKQRTLTQNAALHLGFRLIADALNASGADMRKVLKPAIEIEWTDKAVKKYLFKPVMELMYDKASTTRLAKTMEIENIWDTVMKYLGRNPNVHLEYIPFPQDQERAKYNIPAENTPYLDELDEQEIIK